MALATTTAAAAASPAVFNCDKWQFASVTRARRCPLKTIDWRSLMTRHCLSVCLLECLVAVVEQSLPTLYQHWQMLDQYQYPIVSECPPCPVLCHHSLVVIIAPSLSPSFLSYFNCVMSHRAHILKHTHTASFSCLCLFSQNVHSCTDVALAGC